MSARIVAVAEDVTWRAGIAQIVQARCAGCHDATAKEYADVNLRARKDAAARPGTPGT